MFIRIALLAALATVPLAGTTPAKLPSGAAATVPRDDIVKVAIETSAGRLVVALDRGRAPRTVANFLAYVDGHRYDGQSFYRAMPYTKGGLVQAGITTDARKLLPPVAHEPTSTTGLRNVRGALVMARLDPGTARSDFFILTEDIPAFDASPSDPGFAVFGRVTEGMDIAERIFRSPVSPTRGAGAMKGQMLEPGVRIVRMVRLK